jgi:acetolactate synthase-1/2/3 large subunit
MAAESTDGGEAILHALRRLGVEYVFSSPGSEWGPLWEAFAIQDITRKGGPKYLSCWHEMLAVDLALGYTMATGRMQCVALHAGAGLLQGSMGINGARVLGLPMLVMSGESLTYGEREGFDPGAQWQAALSIVGGPQRLVEPLVKWATQVTSPETLHGMVIRAGELAQRAPVGPTYLNIPIETMLEPWVPRGKMRPIPKPPLAQVPASDLEKVAELLLKSERPVIATEASGKDKRGYQALVRLAEALAIPVVESSGATVNNFPKEHYLHQGFHIRPLLNEADLVLLVRNRVPWYPAKNGPPNATVVVLDETPIKPQMVYQDLQADFYLEGDVPTALEMLHDLVSTSQVDETVVAKRRARWTERHEVLERQRLQGEAESERSPKIDATRLCVALSDAMPADTVYVDETTTHRSLNKAHVRYQGPNSYFRMAGGLGQCLGVSLGIKLAYPDRPLVSLIGDGAFLYNPALASLGFWKEQQLPTMIVVYNNKSYREMRNNHLAYYPQGVAQKHQRFYGESLNGPNYNQLADLFGGEGILIDKPASLRAGLKKACATISAGKMAIVNVELSE